MKWGALSVVLLFLEFNGLLSFARNDVVPVYVNKVGPYVNIHETYHFYQLPLCRPDKIVHKSLSLGQVLEGDRMAESSFTIQFGVDQGQISLCGPKQLSESEVELLIAAVEEDYYFELIMDDLRLRSFLGFVEEAKVLPHEHKVFLYTSYKFIVTSNENTVLRVSLEMERPVQLTHGHGMRLELTYSVKWNTNATLPDSARSQDDSSLNIARSMHIHWLSVLNSAALVVVLVLFLTIIIFSSVRRDLSKYNRMAEDMDDVVLDNGWKTIGMDVFRRPKYPMLMSAIIGVGAQFLVLCAAILVIGSSSLVNVHRHGLLNTLSIVLYALTSGVAGFVSASKYKQFEGKRWIANINLTSLLFGGPLVLAWAASNSVAWAYTSTQALPWTTVLVVFCIWLVFGYPLTVLGGVIGRLASGKYNAPCRTRNIPRQLPVLSWAYSPPILTFIGGFLPFSAVCVELYYVFSTIWGREQYTLFYVLLIVFCLLIAVVACSSVALIYFQLNAEDYRWWWKSVFLGGSTGVFVFMYGIYFLLHHSDMSGPVQLVQFFTHLGLICYASFLAMGTVSHTAVHFFVHYIYSSVKSD